MNSSQGGLQGKIVTLAAQPADNALGDIGEIGVVTEGFPRMHVGKMNFNERNARCQQCVPQRNTGVRERRRVDDDVINAFRTGFVDALNQFVFGVLLQVQQMVTLFGGNTVQSLVDVGQGFIAVNLGLAGAEHVQVGAVKDQYCRHDCFSALPFFYRIAEINDIFQ